MKSIAIGFALMFSAIASSASASNLPSIAVCDMVADAAYQAAIESGDPLPDMAYDSVMNDCDWGGYSSMTLNEMIAQDGEPLQPVCFFTGGCKTE